MSVTDARHIPAEGEEAQYLGGADYTYTITSSPYTPSGGVAQAPPIRQQVSVTAPGLIGWVGVETQAQTLLAVEAMAADLPAHATPIVASYVDSAYSYSETGNALFAPTGSRPLLLGVADERNLGATDTSAYDAVLEVTSFDLTTVSFAQVNEATDNTARESAMPLDLPAAVKGVTQAINGSFSADYFAVSLTPGQMLIAQTTESPDATPFDENDALSGNADTILTLVDAQGTVLARNDDILGQDQGRFSGLFHRSTEGGTFYLVVEPWGDEEAAEWDNGAYVLRTFVR